MNRVIRGDTIKFLFEHSSVHTLVVKFQTITWPKLKLVHQLGCHPSTSTPVFYECQKKGSNWKFCTRRQWRRVTSEITSEPLTRAQICPLRTGGFVFCHACDVELSGTMVPQRVLRCHQPQCYATAQQPPPVQCHMQQCSHLWQHWGKN